MSTDKEAGAIVVIGAGPAGFMASIAAARAGARVTLLEALPRGGAKLLVTGGGRCNLTSALPAADMMARFERAGRFLSPALSALDPQGLVDFVSGLGVPARATDGVHVFPESESACDVRDALERECSRLGVAIRPSTRAVGLGIDGARIAGVDTDSGFIQAAAVIVATGGLSYPGLGSTGAGFELARRAGHTISAPLPALVPLVVRETWVADCAGVVLSPAVVRIESKGKTGSARTGDLLFTHRGISGPVVLDLSGDVSSLLTTQPEVRIRVNCSPCTTAEQWERRFVSWHKDDGRALVRTLLDRHLPAALAAALVRVAGAPGDVRASQLSKDWRMSILRLLAGIPLTVTGTEGFERAIVTRGGVCLREVDPKTLQSRLVTGLYFAGEVLDVDGPCGGFNLQWAFSSGLLAGRSAAAAQAALAAPPAPPRSTRPRGDAGARGGAACAGP